MAHTSGSRSPHTHNTILAIRTRGPLAQNDIVTPAAAPSVDEFRKADEAIRERWTEEQRRRIAENEAVLRQLAEIEPKVDSLSIQQHLPRGNDLTVHEQIAIIHGGATPAQYAATREMLLERHRQDIIDNTSPISPVFPVSPALSSIPQARDTSGTGAEQTYSLEYDDFPELDAKYGHPPTAANFQKLDLNTGTLPKSLTEVSADDDKVPGPAFDNSKQTIIGPRYEDFIYSGFLCTGPCPVQTPHNRGAYLQQGEISRVWNERWGYSDPPREIWEAWVRIEQGRGSTWDEVEVDGFALSHWWAGP